MGSTTNDRGYRYPEGGDAFGPRQAIENLAKDVDDDVESLDASLAPVAKAGTYASLTGKPTLGTAAATDATAYATAAQGAKADTAVQPARTITAGTGLTGGGDLSANRTFAVAYGTTSTTAARGDDARLSDARTPTDSSVTDAKVSPTAAIQPSKIDPARVTFDNADFAIPSAARMVAQVGTLTAPRTVTLPLAATVAAGYVITVKDASGTVGGANTLTVARAGSDLINGSASGVVIATAYAGRQFVSNGLNGWSAIVTPATVVTGTTAGTVAAGDDPRIVGAVQATALGNLLPSSIALGESLTGTVAAGLATLTLAASPAEVGASSYMLTTTTFATPVMQYGGGGVSPNAQAVPVIGGQWYTLIWSVRAVGHTRSNRALLYSWDAGGVRQDNGVIFGPAVASVDGVWVRRSAQFQVAPTANRIAFAIGMTGATSGDTLHIDRLAVIQGAVGSEAWSASNTPVLVRGIRQDPTNPAQAQVNIPGTASWITV